MTLVPSAMCLQETLLTAEKQPQYNDYALLRVDPPYPVSDAAPLRAPSVCRTAHLTPAFLPKNMKKMTDVLQRASYAL